MANIWITGANGQLGTALRERQFSPLDELFFTDIDLDITDMKAVLDFVERNDIDTIINCAAYTAVDRAEEEPEQAARINRDGPANLARASYLLGCLLVHVSTDYVFDGLATSPYAEKDPAAARTVYGRTKWEGERAIKRSGCLHVILRTSWLYSEHGENFLKTILHLASTRDELQVVDDQHGSPTYAGDLADAILFLLSTDDLPEHGGTYHYANAGVCTRHDLAREILFLSGSPCRLTPVSSAHYPSLAPRPPYSALDTTKIRATFSLAIPDWRDALHRCLARLSSPVENPS